MDKVNKIQILTWLQEINQEPLEKFGDYFIEDFIQYLDNDENILSKNSFQILRLMNCKSKAEVRGWIDDLAGFVILKIDVESVLNDYLS